MLRPLDLFYAQFGPETTGVIQKSVNKNDIPVRKKYLNKWKLTSKER
jgi:hypothetical protein